MIATATWQVLLWNRLPDQMASHWNINDQVDGYMLKFWGVFMVPLITLGMFLLFLLIPSIDPLKANIAQFREAFNLFIVLMVSFMLYIYGLSLAWSLGYNASRWALCCPPSGCFSLHRIRSAGERFFIGIRTRGPLSDTVWNGTHRIGAVLFIVSGALAFAGGFSGTALLDDVRPHHWLFPLSARVPMCSIGEAG
jgi:uncharacterized membrane protein